MGVGGQGTTIRDNSIIERLEGTLIARAPRGAEWVDRSYAHLFSKDPQVRPMFPDNRAEQKKKFLASFVLDMQNIRRPEDLRQYSGGQSGDGCVTKP
ncbi:MAG: hypothetical protein O7B26_12835 [Planctomycetota bacterium]|nr:hypothetical protein [Planctomycetota bacterium]